MAEVRSGYYRAWSIESEVACGEDMVWSSDVSAGYTSAAYEQVYADPVPIRADGLSIEVPEPSLELTGSLRRVLTPPWKMRPLARQGASYELEVFFDITFCEAYRHAWTAVVLDDETIHVTREGTGCGPGDGQSRICDNQVAIEYVLEQPCESPCEIANDRDTRLPGDDLILRQNHCEC
jgi:hypothetical protein